MTSSEAFKRPLSLQGIEMLETPFIMPPSPAYSNFPKSDCDKSAVISLKHYNMILSELRCPGCADNMSAPIRLCSKGHSVCDSCSQSRRCPLCQETMSTMRCYTLEAIAAKAHFLCANSGCSTRLPMDLMKWHKERCLYQKEACFLGKVWGDCEWVGCKVDWMQHCVKKHPDKLFKTSPTAIQWQFQECQQIRPVVGYFVLFVFDETFNIYHVYDKKDAKMIWTVTWAAKKSAIDKQFAFEIEIHSPSDPSLLLIERHAVHGEKDTDILADGKCSKIKLGDIITYMGPDKILHYNVKIIEISPFVARTVEISNSPTEPIDHSSEELKLLGQCCNANLKAIPDQFIITKQQSQSKCDDYIEKLQNNSPLASEDGESSSEYRNQLKRFNNRKTIDHNTVFENDEHDLNIRKTNTIPKPPRRFLQKTSSMDMKMLWVECPDNCNKNSDLETVSLQTDNFVRSEKRRSFYDSKPIKVFAKMYEFTKYKVQRKK